jgi:hypothetical protein
LAYEGDKSTELEAHRHGLHDLVSALNGVLGIERDMAALVDRQRGGMDGNCNRFSGRRSALRFIEGPARIRSSFGMEPPFLSGSHGYRLGGGRF